MFKRIASFFKRVNRFRLKAFGDLEGWLNEIKGYFASSVYSTSYTASQFLVMAGKTYNRSADLQEAIDKIVTAIAGFDLVVKNPAGESIPVPKIIKEWLANPSTDYCTYHQFIKNAFIQFYIGGEVFYLKDYTKQKVTLVRPNEVNEIRIADGIPQRYVISHTFFNRTKLMMLEEAPNYGFETFYRNGEPINPVSHFFNRNPILDFRGLSIIISLTNDIEILFKGRSWNRNVLENEGRPCGVLYYPPKSPGTTRSFGGGDPSSGGGDKLEEEVKHFFAGPENAGKVLLLKGGLNFNPITYKMKDMDFLEGLRFSRESIANRLGIPLQMFGSEKKSTYNNMREARISFYMDTCVPLADQFFMFLSRHILSDFFPAFKSYCLAVDTMKIQQSSDRYIETMQALDKVTCLTTNEKREKLGLPPLKLENADTLLVPSGLMDIEDIGSEPMEEDGEEAFAGADDEKDEEEDEDSKDDKKEDDKKDDDK